MAHDWTPLVYMSSRLFGCVCHRGRFHPVWGAVCTCWTWWFWCCFPLLLFCSRTRLYLQVRTPSSAPDMSNRSIAFCLLRWVTSVTECAGSFWEAVACAYLPGGALLSLCIYTVLGLKLYSYQEANRWYRLSPGKPTYRANVYGSYWNIVFVFSLVITCHVYLYVFQCPHLCVIVLKYIHLCLIVLKYIRLYVIVSVVATDYWFGSTGIRSQESGERTDHLTTAGENITATHTCLHTCIHTHTHTHTHTHVHARAYRRACMQTHFYGLCFLYSEQIVNLWPLLSFRPVLFPPGPHTLLPEGLPSNSQHSPQLPVSQAAGDGEAGFGSQNPWLCISSRACGQDTIIQTLCWLVVNNQLINYLKYVLQFWVCLYLSVYLLLFLYLVLFILMFWRFSCILSSLSYVCMFTCDLSPSTTRVSSSRFGVFRDFRSFMMPFFTPRFLRHFPLLPYLHSNDLSCTM